MNPDILYHGSEHKINGAIQPVLDPKTPDHQHARPAVFATERLDIASLFMFPTSTLASIGFEQDIAYICIWGTRDQFTPHDGGGYIYTLASEEFEKIGKWYEWQSFSPVQPIESKHFPSVIDSMIECGAQVYFIDDNTTFDLIVADKYNRAPLLEKLLSENQKRGICVRAFTPEP